MRSNWLPAEVFAAQPFALTLASIAGFVLDDARRRRHGLTDFPHHPTPLFARNLFHERVDQLSPTTISQPRRPMKLNCSPDIDDARREKNSSLAHRVHGPTLAIDSPASPAAIS